MCEHRGATEVTETINQALRGELPFDYTKDFERGARGDAEQAVLELRNGSLNHSLGRLDQSADAVVTLDRETLNRVIVGEADLLEEAKRGEIGVEPNVAPLADFLGLLDTFDLWFNVIEPHASAQERAATPA